MLLPGNSIAVAVEVMLSPSDSAPGIREIRRARHGQSAEHAVNRYPVVHREGEVIEQGRSDHCYRSGGRRAVRVRWQYADPAGDDNGRGHGDDSEPNAEHSGRLIL